MDAQMTGTQDPLHHPHGVGGEEEHHEKKSVFKKVRAKAKKVKDTIASKARVGHGHGHEQEHGSDNQHDEEDEYDDQDDEEDVQDPEVHGDPRYESGASKNSAMGPDVNRTRASAGPTSPPAKVTATDHSAIPAPSKYDSVAPWDSSLDQDAKSGQFKGTLGDKFKHTNVPEGTLGEISDPLTAHDEPASPKRHGAGHDENSSFFKSPLGVPLDEPPREEITFNGHKRRHEDTPARSSDFGANVGSHNTGVSPTDGGVTPILHSFDKMAIHDEPQQNKKDSVTTDSPDQFSPSPVPESFGVATDQKNHPEDMNVDQTNTQQGSYTGKISSMASTVADRAISAKNALASKIGYGGNNDRVTSQNVGEANVSGLEPPKQQQQGTYTEKLSSAKNVVASKLGYGGTDTAPVQKSELNERGSTNLQAGGDNVNVSSSLEPPKPQGTYTEKLSSGTTAIADKAASAKNVVASKLGYDGADNTQVQGTELDKEGKNKNAQSGGGVTGYGRQIASTVTGKLAPVYGAVAGAGSAVLSKIPGTGMGTQQKTGEDAGTGSVRDSDKGVGMKGYLSEKLKPGDEDRALSEVISGALHKGGTTVQDDRKSMGETKGTRGVHETVKGALHKENTDDDREKMNVPMGKVTESEEVANRLGSSEEERTGKVYPGTGNESPSTGVVDKVKGAFTNWFGKGGETNPSMAFNDQSAESQGTIGDENASGDGARRP